MLSLVGQLSKYARALRLLYCIICRPGPVGNIKYPAITTKVNVMLYL